MNIDFQSIVNILQTVFPKEWDRIVFYAEYTTGSYSMKYYFKSESDEYKDCYSIKEFNKAQFVKVYKEINKILSKERDNLSDENKWFAFTLILNADGKFKSEFDYNSHEEKVLQFQEDWKKKYLI